MSGQQVGVEVRGLRPHQPSHRGSVGTQAAPRAEAGKPLPESCPPRRGSGRYPPPALLLCGEVPVSPLLPHRGEAEN